MSKDAPEKEVAFSPLVADVFTAMFKQSETTTNRVLENHERETAAWKAKFLGLFEALDRANESVDSARIDRLLSHYAWDAERASQTTTDK